MFDRNQRAWVSKLAERRGATLTNDAAAGHRPKPGDLVITREVRDRTVRYTIGRLDKQPQLSCASRDTALNVARAYAARDRVDIWEQATGAFRSISPRGFGNS